MIMNHLQLNNAVTTTPSGASSARYKPKIRPTTMNLVDINNKPDLLDTRRRMNSVSPMHHQGPYTYDIRQVFNLWNPSPLVTQPPFLLFDFLGPPSIADVTYECSTTTSTRLRSTTSTDRVPQPIWVAVPTWWITTTSRWSTTTSRTRLPSPLPTST